MNTKKLKVGVKVHIVSGPLSGSGGKVIHIQGGILWFVYFGVKVCFLVLLKLNQADSSDLSSQLSTVMLSRRQHLIPILHLVTL